MRPYMDAKPYRKLKIAALLVALLCMARGITVRAAEPRGGASEDRERDVDEVYAAQEDDSNDPTRSISINEPAEIRLVRPEEARARRASEPGEGEFEKIEGAELLSRGTSTLANRGSDTARRVPASAAAPKAVCKTNRLARWHRTERF